MELASIFFKLSCVMILVIIPFSNGNVINKVKSKANNYDARIVHKNKNKEHPEIHYLIAHSVIKPDVTQRTVQKTNNVAKDNIAKCKNKRKGKFRTEKIINTRFKQKNSKTFLAARHKVRHSKLNKYGGKATPLPIFLSHAKSKKKSWMKTTHSPLHKSNSKYKKILLKKYKTPEDNESSKYLDDTEVNTNADTNNEWNLEYETVYLKAIDNISLDVDTTSHSIGKRVTLCSTKQPLPELDPLFLPIETTYDASIEKRADSDDMQGSEHVESNTEASEEDDEIPEQATDEERAEADGEQEIPEQATDEERGEADGEQEIPEQGTGQEDGEVDGEQEIPEQRTTEEDEVADGEQVEIPEQETSEEDGNADGEQAEETEEQTGEESRQDDEGQTEMPDEDTVEESRECDQSQVDTSDEESSEEVRKSDNHEGFLSTRYKYRSYIQPKHVTTVAYYIDDE